MLGKECKAQYTHLRQHQTLIKSHEMELENRLQSTLIQVDRRYGDFQSQP